jgi:hypothetical protein
MTPRETEREDTPVWLLELYSAGYLLHGRTSSQYLANGARDVADWRDAMMFTTLENRQGRHLETMRIIQLYLDSEGYITIGGMDVRTEEQG